MFLSWEGNRDENNSNVHGGFVLLFLDLACVRAVVVSYQLPRCVRRRSCSCRFNGLNPR